MIVTIPLPEDQEPEVQVTKAQRIDPGDLLVKLKGQKTIQKVNLSAVLNVANSRILKYTLKKQGSEVKAGEPLAEKKSLFSSLIVKSPFNGVVTEIDTVNGMVLISDMKASASDIYSGIKGKMLSSDAKGITIEYEGAEYDGEIISGRTDISAVLKCIRTEEVSGFDVDSSYAGFIVACRRLTDDIPAKMSVLGVSGLVTTSKVRFAGSLPVFCVQAEVMDKILSMEGASAWIRIREGKVIIFR